MHNNQSDEMQRHDVKETLDEFSHLLRWRTNGCDSVLDIGSRCGDIVKDFLLPILPPNFQRLVGIDTTQEMLEFARRKNSHSRVSFEKADIGLNITVQPFNDTESFDHITSFHYLHWVQDQECAVRNMYKLLKQGGDILVTFLVSNPIFDIFKQMSQSGNWAKYTENGQCFISQCCNSTNPVDHFQQLLSSNGFTDIKIEIRKKTYTFVGLDTLISNISVLL